MLDGKLIVNREDKLEGCNAKYQNMLYYSHHINENTKELTTVLPAIFLTLEGTVMTVSGAIVTREGTFADTYHCWSIENIINDDKHNLEVARSMCALRKSVERLIAYAKNTFEVAQPGVDGFPYYRIGDLVLTKRLSDSKVFQGIYKNRDVIVKFSRSRVAGSSQDACKDAPQVYHIDKISGGWFIIIMQYICAQTYHELKNAGFATPSTKKSVEEAVKRFHSLGYVHGDIRPNNILVDDNEKVYIIDFDWAGKKNVAKYPYFMNHKDINWPHGASPGSKITHVHDLEMIARLF